MTHNRPRSCVERALGWLLLACAASGAWACGNGDDQKTKLEPALDDVMNPDTCKSCHPKHYDEWASSMHAYAADDPLFLAMNRRGQREAQIGSFCVNCHAPVAVRTGATTDGLNLAELEPKLKGVTCYFCHSVDQVRGSHDNPLHLASDLVMRGELSDAVPNGFHESSYSTLHDRNRLESSQLCGSCHDIVNGHGVHLERTLAEWQETVFAEPKIGTTCGQCHMDQSADLEPASLSPASAPLRRLRSHRFPAVDLALTPLPGSDELAKAVQSFLDTSLQTALCVRGAGSNSQIQVVLDNVAAGHRFPSGAAQDRRVWLDVTAYANGSVVYQSGALPPGAALSSIQSPDLAWLGDCLLDDQGKQVRMFWEARDVESTLLPGQLTFDPSDPRYYQSHVVTQYPRQGTIAAFPDRVTLSVRLAPFGLDVFDELAASGDLTDTNGVSVAEMRAALATRTVGAELEWTPDAAQETFTDRGLPVSCVSQSNLLASADKVARVDPSRCGP